MDYAITAKKTRQPITVEHYKDYLDYLGDLGEVANVKFEQTRGLHIHFVLRTKERLDYRLLLPTKYGWNVKSVPIYNLRGWDLYCRKDVQFNEPNNKYIEKFFPSKPVVKKLFS